MTASDVAQAEHYSRARSILMAVMAVVLLVDAAIGSGDEASSMTPGLREAAWALMIGLWLIILVTGGFLRVRGAVRGLMNDEVATANRSQALQAGFWVATVAGLGLYFASPQWQQSAREALRILVDLAIAAALMRYAWLELR
jgi:hypothetical protein